MQSFFRREIEWIAQELAKEADRQKRIGEMKATTEMERDLCTLRAEQFQSIAERLAAAVADGDKRIAIR